MTETKTVKVWDGFVRLFHWSLVAGILVAGVTGFIIGGRAIDIHIWSGTAAVTLVALRVVWGFLGPGVARFSDFLRGPGAALAHLRGKERHLGHNPLGGWMVLALVGSVLALGASGVLVLGGVFHVGPAKALLTVSEGFALRELHEVLAIGLLVLVAGHIAGVVFESLRERENLARAMVTGRKAARPGDVPLPSVKAHPLVASVIGAGGMLAMSGLVVVMAASSVPDAPVEIAGTDIETQCSDCHMAYHPSLLPAASWGMIMANLDDHFGEDASLPAETTATITAFLLAHSADTTDSKPAVLLRSNTALEITGARAWKRIHDDLPEAIFEGADVRGEGNCAACHADAATGWFYPGTIEIPETARAAATDVQMEDENNED